MGYKNVLAFLCICTSGFAIVYLYSDWYGLKTPLWKSGKGMVPRVLQHMFTATVELSEYPKQNKSTVSEIPPLGRSLRDGLLSGQPVSNLGGGSCCDLTAGVSLDVLCGNVSAAAGDGNGSHWVDRGSGKDVTAGCSCKDIILCRLVVVTAFSTDHFDEATDMIASVQKFLPGTKIIAYDLGLTETQKRIVISYCSLELRTFPFENYPPHVNNLLTYAWKPLIIREAAQNYEVILYGDASIRIQSEVNGTVLRDLLNFPYVACPPHSWPTISLTHDGMLSYFDFNISRKEAVTVLPTTIQATGFLLWLDKKMRQQFLTNWVDCALHEECIAPKGSWTQPCNYYLLRSGDYAECHRFDQSALNVIFIQQLGVKTWAEIQSTEYKREKSFFSIYRYPTHIHNVQKCSL